MHDPGSAWPDLAFAAVSRSGVCLCNDLGIGMVKQCGVILLTGALAACAGTLDDAGGLYMTPGKFDLLKCPDLANRSTVASSREKQLISLMDRANQDTAGPVVNALVYSNDLNTVRAELALLRKTAAEKHCDNLVTQADQPRGASQPIPKPTDQPNPKQPRSTDLPALH